MGITAIPREACVFAQFLRLRPRYEFKCIVDKYNADCRTRPFECWNQVVCMTFAHIRQENSLRDIDIAPNAHADKLYHFGIQQFPRLHFSEVNLFAQKPLVSVFQSNARASRQKFYNQLKVLEF